MTDFQKQLATSASQVKKAIFHLKYSLVKVEKLSTEVENLDSEDLETWEGFVSRFARVSDLFLSRYLRTFILRGDPAFRGTLRDSVDAAEKQGLIDSADEWMRIRELRNLSVHEYSNENLARDLEEMRSLANCLISLENKI